MKSIVMLLFGARKFNQAYGAEGWSWVIAILIALVVSFLAALLPYVIAKHLCNIREETCGKIYVGAAGVCLLGFIVL